MKPYISVLLVLTSVDGHPSQNLADLGNDEALATLDNRDEGAIVNHKIDKENITSKIPKLLLDLRFLHCLSKKTLLIKKILERLDN